MDHLEWIDDPKLYEITESNTGLKYYFDDAYAQWTLGPGRDFEVTESIRKPGKPADYRYFSVVRELDETVEVGLALDEAKPVSIEATADSRNNYIQRLPIRAFSELQDHDVAALALYDPPHGLSPKQTVVIGIIDDSFNPVHERFLLEDEDGFISTRFDYLWVQDARAPSINSSPVSYGREYKREEIAAALNKDPNYDELTVLKNLGLIDMRSVAFQPNPLQYNMNHGGFVTNVATGYSIDQVTAIDRRIVAAQLPIMATQDTSGSTLISSIICSIQYIFNRAKLMSDATSTALPVVINFSYGLFGGPHNGKHIVEQAFLKNAKKYRNAVRNLKGGKSVPVEIILPAGNNALAQSHARTMTATGSNKFAKLPINLRIQPEDHTSSFVEFWLPRDASHTKINVTLPDGSEAKFKLNDLNEPFGQILAVKAKTEIKERTIVARLKLDCPLREAKTDGAENYWRILLSIAPTVLLDSEKRPAPAGIWRIDISAKIPKEAYLSSWIQRDVAVSGASFQARQSYFEDSVYENNRFDKLTDIAVTDRGNTHIKRNGTTSGIATLSTSAKSKIGITVVGGYKWSNNAGCAYSAAGSNEVKSAQTMAVADTSRALNGILSIGTLSGSVGSLGGTSVASPQIARLLADAIAKIPPDKRNQYSREQALATLGTGPITRPSKVHPELLTSDVIRSERNKTTRLKPLDALIPNIQRGRYSSK